VSSCIHSELLQVSQTVSMTERALSAINPSCLRSVSRGVWTVMSLDSCVQDKIDFRQTAARSLGLGNH
jgi:hypothetical protein